MNIPLWRSHCTRTIWRVLNWTIQRLRGTMSETKESSGIACKVYCSSGNLDHCSKSMDECCGGCHDMLVRYRDGVSNEGRRTFDPGDAQVPPSHGHRHADRSSDGESTRFCSSKIVIGSRRKCSSRLILFYLMKINQSQSPACLATRI